MHTLKQKSLLFAAPILVVFAAFYTALFIHSDIVNAKPSCTFSVNEKKTAVNRSCSDINTSDPGETMLGAKATLTGSKNKFSRTYQAYRSQSAEQSCTETVTLTSNTTGTHSITSKSGNAQCGTSLGSIKLSFSGGSGNAATKQLLASYINDQCKNQPNASLQSECRESWDFVIDQCVTQVGGSTTKDFQKKLSDCIANKKNVSSSDIQKALKNLESDVADLDKQEACDKDNKDYSKDLKKCVERCEDGQDLNDKGQCIDKTSCAVDGIGWVVCPVLTFLGKLNDVAYGFLNNFLEVPARLFNDQATKAAWDTFKNFANVAFIIAFLVIIYSQITGAGISNYGLKRLLPKLIIAAILVNISFYICAILVDLSNIVGSSLFDLLKNIKATPNTVDGGGAGSDIWSTAIAFVLGAGALIGLLAVVLFAPMTLLAFALVILILIGRQAFVILLIVISPLAFVAYLLPNTEQWFKKWWKSFTAMLMVFPIIALVFGASSLASSILMSVSEDCKGSTNTEATDLCKENGQKEGDDDQLMKIIAAAVLAVPLFAVPFLLKSSLSAAGSIGGKIAGMQSRANGMAGKSMKNGRLGEAKRAFDTQRQSRRVNRRVGDGIGNRINKKIDNSRFGRLIGGDIGAARAVAEQHKMSNEAVESSVALLNHRPAGEVIGAARKQLEDANRTGDIVAARAATRVLAKQTGSRGVDVLHQTLSGIEGGSGLNEKVAEDVKHEVNGASLKAKNRSLDKWSRDETKTLTGSPQKLTDYDSDSSTTRGLNEAEITGHSVSQLERYAETTGGIDQDLANRVIAAHSSGNLQLDADKLEVFTNAAAGKTYNSGTKTWS